VNRRDGLVEQAYLLRLIKVEIFCGIVRPLE
jgi:hypothetical protein